MAAPQQSSAAGAVSRLPLSRARVRRGSRERPTARLRVARPARVGEPEARWRTAQACRPWQPRSPTASARHRFPAPLLAAGRALAAERRGAQVRAPAPPHGPHQGRRSAPPRCPTSRCPPLPLPAATTSWHSLRHVRRLAGARAAALELPCARRQPAGRAAEARRRVADTVGEGGRRETTSGHASAGPPALSEAAGGDDAVAPVQPHVGRSLIACMYWGVVVVAPSRLPAWLVGSRGSQAAAVRCRPAAVCVEEKID